MIKTTPAEGVPQIVSYSSRIMSNISDIVRVMNISAASSVKTGTVNMSGNTMNIDTMKFTESDLNAVISVKVRLTLLCLIFVCSSLETRV